MPTFGMLRRKRRRVETVDGLQLCFNSAVLAVYISRAPSVKDRSTFNEGKRKPLVDDVRNRVFSLVPILYGSINLAKRDNKIHTKHLHDIKDDSSLSPTGRRRHRLETLFGQTLIEKW